jgi:hypothetical protein
MGSGYPENAFLAEFPATRVPDLVIAKIPCITSGLITAGYQNMVAF